jgi:hypothetical protein
MSDVNTPTPTSSLGAGSTIALSERDFDGDGTLNIFESTAPSLVSCTAGQYGFYLCVDAPAGKYVQLGTARYADDCVAGTYQADTGQTDCDIADSGYYVDSTLGVAQSSQTACLA